MNIHEYIFYRKGFAFPSGKLVRGPYSEIVTSKICHGPINGYDEYINNTLTEELSQLSFNTPSLAPYDCPVDPSALHSDANKESGKHINNNNIDVSQPGETAVGLYGSSDKASREDEPPITIFAVDSSATRYKRSDKNKMGQKGKKVEKEVALPDEHQKGFVFAYSPARCRLVSFRIWVVWAKIPKYLGNSNIDRDYSKITCS
ncbi:hypothetical protein BGZ57DRAFT_970073 [Hyaloscypha finlandica]|nr:hypothetical protein BGZ57DRAFT_970073 [Hyaloscypha finlandica]